MDLTITEKSHPFNEPLHWKYVENLLDYKSGQIIILHDHLGNLEKSTYHYLGLKAHDIYEAVSSFLTVSITPLASNNL